MRRGRGVLTCALPLILNKDGFLLVAHFLLQGALVGIGVVVRATDRGKLIDARRGTLLLGKTSVLRARGGEALFGLRDANFIRGTVVMSARFFRDAVKLGAGRGEALFGGNLAMGSFWAA